MDAAFMLFKRHESGIHAVRIHPRIRTTSHASTLTTQQHQEPRSGAAWPGPDAPARAETPRYLQQILFDTADAGDLAG
jgi:hypothetical protein